MQFVCGLGNCPTDTILMRWQCLRRNSSAVGDFLRLGVEINSTTEGHGSNCFLVTSKEKTMIDCINKPLLSGDYPAVIHAIANHKINVIDTLNLCQKMNNGGAIKRLGYLFEMFQIDGHEAFTDFATNNLPSGYILLDPSGYDEGSYSNKWGLRLNITKDDLLSIKDNLY